MKKARMTTDVFNKLIEATKGFAQKSGSKPIHNYIRLEFHSTDDEVVAIAVDGYKMSVEHGVCNSEEDFAVYVKSNIKLPNAIFISLRSKNISERGEYTLIPFSSRYLRSSDAPFLSFAFSL